MSKNNVLEKKDKNIFEIIISAILILMIIGLSSLIAAGFITPKENGKLLFNIDDKVFATVEVGGRERFVMPNPEAKDGYSFGGWYFDKDTLSDPCTPETISDKKLEGATNVFAKWIKNEYTIIYNLDGGENAKVNPSGYAVDTPTITLVSPSKLGYTFDGWYSEETFATKVTEITKGSTGDKTLFAKWTKNDFAIIYKNLEGATNNALNPGGYDVTTATIALADPSRDGYTFDGWYDANVGGNKVTEIANGSTGNKTLFARWKAIEYGIIYNLNGGVNAAANPNTYTIDQATALAAPTREGYTFEGWYAEDTFKTKVTEIAKGSMDVKAVFAKWSLDTYTITYELNGQFVDNPNVVDNYNIYSPTITLKNASRNGYIFEGWDDANVGGNKVTEIATGSTGNKTLFARWVVEEYAITYNLDGGTNSLDNPTKYTIESGTITFAAPTKVGYAFNGWYDAKAVANVFDKIMTGSTGDKKVFAKWTVTTYSVAYILKDANNDHGNATLYKVTDGKQALKAPTSNSNWLGFVGWFDAPTGGNQVTTIGGGATGNLTLYDRWKLIGTTGLLWSNVGDAWEVSADGALSGVVAIPSKHGNDGLPVRIKTKAFLNATGITSIVIEDGVTSIGSQAFYGCTGLANIDIPNSVKSIADYAFNGCTSLASVVIPSDIKIIDEYAFQDCSGLTSVVIPNGVTELKGSAFKGCSKLASVTIPNTVTELKTGAFLNCIALTSVNIPSSMKIIGSQAFEGCAALTSVNIPNKVTSIGGYAFLNCTNLASIFIPNSVLTMGSDVFMNCKVLTIYCELTGKPDTGWNIRWYGNVPQDTNIKWSHFLSTDGLIYGANGAGGYIVVGSLNVSGNVTIPATFNGGTVTAIGEKAFYGNADITSVVIASGVTSVGVSAFEQCSILTSVTIPNTVTSIGKSAFYGCATLPKIFIPSSVATMGTQVFGSCNAITIYCEATAQPGTWDGAWNSSGMPEVWGKLLSEDGFIYVSDGKDGYKVMGHNNPGTVLIIPDKFNGKFVTSIGESAFSTNTAIYSVVIPDSVTSIEPLAFQSCKWLWNVKLPNNLKSIGRQAFYLCSSLESVNIPSGVTIIEDSVFRETDISSVVIPSGVTSIGDNAFANCKLLTSVNIPSRVTEIGGNAFNGCNALMNIFIPSSVTTIGGNVFQGCAKIRIHCEAEVAPAYNLGSGAGWYNSESIYWYGNVSTNYIHWGQIPSGDGYFYQLNADGTYAVSGHNNPTGTLAIPETFKTKAVTGIADYAFFNQDNITSVVTPGKVTSIGKSAFQESDTLTSVTVPNSVTSIGVEAFKSCISLNSMFIPSSVMTMGANAFNLSNISTIYCEITSAEATARGWNANWNTSAKRMLWSQSLAANGLIYQDVGAGGAGGYVVTGCNNVSGNIEIPNMFNGGGVIAIGNGAFINQKGITSVVISDNVTSIDQSAFSGCSSLASVKMPINLNVIGQEAFYNCGSLTSIFIPDKVTTMGSNVFGGCANIRIYCELAGEPSTGWNKTSTPWNNTVAREKIHWKQIPSTDGWFYESDGNGGYLVSGYANPTGDMVIPSTFNGRNVTQIAPYAFYNQTGITSVVIPDGVTSIGGHAFEGCNKIANVTISNSVRSIGEMAFNGCSALESVKIPGSVTSIERYAFAACTKLLNIFIPKTVTSMGANVFDSCSADFTVYCGATGAGAWTATWSNGVQPANIYWTKILSEDGFIYEANGDSYIVKGYRNVSGEVVIPDVFNGRLVTSIADKAFQNNMGITSVVIPDSVKKIGDYAFEGCSALTSVKMASGVEIIGLNAFENCNSLASMNIPSSVKTINSNAFAGCGSLTSVFIPTSVTTMGQKVFDCDVNLTVYCEVSSKPSGWDSLWDKTMLSYEIKWEQIVADDGFIYQVDGKGDYILSGCFDPSGDIVIPSTLYGRPVISIGKYAFFYKRSITSVSIPDGVTSIGASAFQHCTALKSVIIPDGVTTMGEHVFKDCMSLMSVFIPSSVTTIGSEAFHGCSIVTISCQAPSKPDGWDAKWMGRTAGAVPADRILWGQTRPKLVP